MSHVENVPVFPNQHLIEHLASETPVQSLVPSVEPICPILCYQWVQTANQEQCAPEIQQP